MKLYPIHTGFFKLDGGAMFGVVPKTIWNKKNPADENNLCTWAMRCLLIEDGDQLILIDTGLGNKQSEKFFSYYYPHGPTLDESLEKAGFSPEDITDVFLTHLHFDHVGGATIWNEDHSEIVLKFPNARYWSNRYQWAWAKRPNAREKASFLPENLEPIEKSGQLNFVEPNEKVFPQFDILFVDGHTEKQMLPLIRYGSKKILYAADLLPSTGHIPLPYVMSYDIRPLTTMEEKARTMKKVLDHDYFVFFEHDPDVEVATLKSTEKGPRVDSTMNLTDIL